MAISPEQQTYSRELVRELDLPFEVLEDHGNAVAAEYGLAYTLPAKLRWVYETVFVGNTAMHHLFLGLEPSYVAEFEIDLPRFNGEDSWRLPMPARYVVARNGLIQAADVNLDHTNRPAIEPTLDVLRRLRA